METWKVMAWAAGIFALFGVVVTVGNVPISGPGALGVLAVVAVAAVVMYALGKRGFRIGQRIGEGMNDDD